MSIKSGFTTFLAIGCVVGITACDRKPSTSTAQRSPTSMPYDGAAEGFASWSDCNTSETPAHHTPFLGPLGNTPTSLTLAGLPKHDFLRIRFDLLLMKSLDGVDRIDANWGTSGPDYWSLRLDDRPALIRSAISATPDVRGFAFAAKMHTFPSAIPSMPVAAGTGSAGVNAEGFVMEFRYANVSFPMDGLYHVDLILPHSAANGILTAQGFGLSGTNDEGWGLANVKIDALTTADVPPLSAEALQQSWADAASPDVLKSRDGFWKLVTGGDAAVEFLKKQDVPPGFNTADVESRLNAAVGDEPDAAFEARQDLIAMGPGIESILLPSPQFTGPDDPQFEKIMQQIDLRPIVAPQARAAAVKARALACINTPAAREALRDWLAKGAPYALDARRKLESQYHVPDGVSLVYVPKPDPAGRADFINLRRHFFDDSGLKTRPHSAYNGDSSTIAMVYDLAEPTPNIETPGRAIGLSHLARTQQGMLRPPGTIRLEELFQALAGFQNSHQPAWKHIELPPELENLPLTGDWVSAYNTSQEEKLADLCRVLTEQLGKPVKPDTSVRHRFRTTIQGQPTLSETVRANRADWSKIPAPIATAIRDGIRKNYGSDDFPAVDVFLDEPDKAAPPTTPPFVVSLASAIPVVGSQVEREVQFGDRSVVTSKESRQRVMLVWHPAAWTAVQGARRPGSADPKQINTILNNVAAELGVKVQHEPLEEPALRLVVGK